MKFKLFESKKEMHRILIAAVVFAISTFFSIVVYNWILQQPQDYSNILWSSTGDRFGFILIFYGVLYSPFVKGKSTKYFVIYLIGFFVLANALSVISALMK